MTISEICLLRNSTHYVFCQIGQCVVLTVQQQGTKRILSLGANLSPTSSAGPTDKKVRSDIIEINGSSQSQVVLTPIDSRPAY